MLRVHVTVEYCGTTTTISRDVHLSDKVSDLVSRLLHDLFGVTGMTDTWELLCYGLPLPLHQRLEDLIKDQQEAYLLLRPRPVREPASRTFGQDHADGSLLDENAAESADFSECPRLEAPVAEGDEVESRLPPVGQRETEKAEMEEEAEVAFAGEGDADAAEAEAEEEAVAIRAKPIGKERRSTSRSGVERRATVRHYTRMNPERVYPFVVYLTAQMVRRIAKKDTDQRASRPFEVELEMPVEVEPVLPGCFCYPARHTVRLGRADTALTFHVVPHVLGDVSGAKVLIRQDHRILAEVPVETRVVQRTIVLLCGAMTFLLPLLSSVLRHFGLDFESQAANGFNLYLAVMTFVFQKVSPLALTLTLGGLTACLYWITRPRLRDTFWDFKVIGPDEALTKVKRTLRTDKEGAARELADLLHSYPTFGPALLLYAGLQFQQGNYRSSLTTYEKAFPETGKPLDYSRASLSASRLGDNRKALSLLQAAVDRFSAGEITGVMWFNMGCYHARLDHVDKVVPCLRKAIERGYRKLSSYQTDSDLNPVRQTREFAALLNGLRKRLRAEKQ